METGEVFWIFNFRDMF